ncbi:unnamed protein product [Mytilus coruscus]|uniref:SGNH hydrolase-type esterase domain-containing protein n=1 Tax=Mytilus coruscus TaxID=42192 RepID=A0A6J8DF02_MYTCO|nr:unnamed protein product [Mytilus coruscus]
MSTTNVNSEFNSTLDSFSFSDSEFSVNESCNVNQQKCRKNKKILPNEEVSTDFQFDRFDDEGNAVRVPCDIKFGTTLTRKHLWIEACKEVMLGKFTVTENVTRNGLQLQCSTKSEGKFVSITFYTNGTILVQGKHICITWRDTYFSKIRNLVNIKEREVSEASFNYDFDNLGHTEVSIENSQTTAKADFRNDSPTIPNELPTNCENDNNMNLEEVSLSSTVIQENTSAIQPATIVMPKQMSSSAQNAELIKIINNKEIENTKLRNEREECRGSEQKLQAQVSRLSSDLKLANQTITGLEDDISVLSKQIAGKNENKNVVSHTPKPKRKLSKDHASFNSGILLSSAPASSAVTTSVEGKKDEIKQSTTRQKLKLKIGNNRIDRISDNILILGSSITKGIKTTDLNDNVYVNTNRGALVSDLERKIEEIDLSTFSTIVLQFGGNDAKLSIQTFKRKYKNVIQSAKNNGIKSIIIGGCLPRSKTNLEHINQALSEISIEENVTFINHLDSFVLRNGEIVPGLIHTDGVHLTNSGTTKLIDNINKVIPIRNVNSSVQPYQTYDRNTWDSYCYNCGSNYHTLSNCKHHQRIKRNFCFRLGHKEINCWYNHSA